MAAVVTVPWDGLGYACLPDGTGNRLGKLGGCSGRLGLSHTRDGAVYKGQYGGG